MATRVSYLNSENTYWQDIDLKNVERDFFTDGVADWSGDAGSPSAVGSDLQVVAQSTPNKTMKIKVGVAYFGVNRSEDADGDGVADTLVLRFHNLAEQTLTIPDNTSGTSKTYEICCSIPAANMNATQINATASNIGQIIVQDQGTGLTNKLLLATVTVENGFTQVTEGKITDNRVRVAFKVIPKGLTATISEINLALDGILASAANLNVLENTTVTKQGFNTALTGITVSAAELNLLDDVAGLVKSDLQKLADIDASADEIDQALDGVSPDVTAANMNILVGGGFTNLHKHAADPLLSGITESPVYFYLPSGEAESVAEKGIMTRFFYAEDADDLDSENIGVVNDSFQSYEAKFREITNFEGDSGETYTGGSFDTVEYKQGTQGLKRQLSIDSTGTLLIDFSPSKTLTGFSGTDTIEFWIYVTSRTNTDMATIQIGSTTPSSNYFLNNFLAQITGNGWNKISIPMNSFTTIGSPSWSTIARVRFEFSTTTGGSADYTVDSLSVIKSDNTTGAFWGNSEGKWEIHTVGGVRRYVKTDESSGDKNSLLSLGTQSRSYQNGILTVRIRRLQGAGSTGVKWRYGSATSYYAAYFTATDLKLGKMSGTFTELASVSFPFANSSDFWLKVRFNAAQMVVSISLDGVTFTDQISAADSAIASTGQVALFDNGSIAAFDHIVFEQTSETSERSVSDNVVRVEENTGFGDTFDDQDIFVRQYEASGGAWAVEESIDEEKRYLLQSNASASEKLLLLKTDGESNKFTNFTLRENFRLDGGGSCACIFKYQDASNFLRLQYQSGRISFVRRLAGVDTVFGEEMAFTPSAESLFSLKVECDSNVFRYFYSEDGSVWIRISEVSVTNFLDGQIGVLSKNSELRVDELVVFEHNVGGDTYYQIFYDPDGNVSSIIKKPVIS